MKCIYILPGKKPEVKEIENELEQLQAAVGGYIECIYPFEDQVGIICNEEGKINGMELNRALYSDKGQIYDIVAGPMLVVGLSDEDFRDLTDEEVEKYTEMYRQPETFVIINGRINVIKEK